MPRETPPSNLLVTEADIIARRHELEMAREESHKRQIGELEAKVKELEAKRHELESLGRQDLHRLTLAHHDLEEKLRACSEQQQQCLRDIKASQEAEILRYRTELSDLQTALASERNELTKKQTMITEFEGRISKDKEVNIEDQETLRKLIHEEQAKLDKMTKEHDEMKKRYKAASEEKLQAFQKESEDLNDNIAAINREMEKKKREHKKAEAELHHRRDELKKEVDKEREERERKLAPLLKEREKLVKKNEEIHKRIHEAKEKEEEKTEDMLKTMEDEFYKNQHDFEKERNGLLKKIAEKETQVKEKEAELQKMKSENDENLREAEIQMMQKIHKLEEDMKMEEQKGKMELERASNIGKPMDLEEEIHKKTCELHNQEANNQAEEALLKFNLEAASDKEKNLREEMTAKQNLYAGKISQLEAELMNAKQKSDNEQRHYDQLKADLDRRLQEKRSGFENHLKDAARRLNELNNQVVDLQRSLKQKEESVKERSESSDKRIQDEVKKLQTLKTELEQQIEPLKKKRSELQKKLQQDQAQHRAQLRELQSEQEAQAKDQEAEIQKMLSLLTTMREQFKDERQTLQQALKDILDANDKLREKHEAEVMQLHLRLVQTLQTTGAQNIDLAATEELMNRVNELQKELAEKNRKLDAMQTRQQEERLELQAKNEREIRQIKSQMTRGGTQEDLMDEKKLGTTKTTAPLQEDIDVAKAKNAELQDSLNHRKTEINKLMNNKELDIGEQKQGSNAEDSLKNKVDAISTLRGHLGKEMQERDKLTKQISRLEKETPSNLGTDQRPINSIMELIEKKEQQLKHLNSSLGLEPENHDIAVVKQQLELLRSQLPASFAEQQFQEVKEESRTRGGETRAVERKSTILGKLNVGRQEDKRAPISIVGKGFDKEMSVNHSSPSVHPIRRTEENLSTSDLATQ